MDGRGFRFGDWQVDVGGNSLSHGDARATLEPRAMDVLRYLCRHPGAVIPAEELLQSCWGTSELGDNPVHKAIAQLRRALGDSSTEPRYIETVRKRGYRAIAEVIEQQEAAGLWHAGSPFRGLEAFQESHAAIFFGRVQATSQLRETVLRQVASGCPMALVLGPSGSGKTSLVRAGLLPTLTDADTVALTCVLHMDCADLAGGDLFGALAAVLVDAECDERRLFEGSSADALSRRLRDEPDAIAATLGGAAPIRIALFVDRLEAIFRAPSTTDADRIRFVGALQTLALAGTLVILASRNDFYPALIALPELMALKSRGGHFDVEPPDGGDIAQMVRQPARAAQLSFEHDAATGANLDDVLCDAARASPDALPLLQYCLDELYRQRGDDGALRFDVFRKLGGIEGALGVRAEQIVAALPAAQQAALPHVLSLLVNIGEERTAVTARRPAWSALTHEAQRELVRALVEARLFVSELTGDVPTFGVAHEALLRRWPRVVEWVERHRQSLQIRTRVAAQAERWAAAGRPRDLLLPAGMQTNQACGLLEIADLALSQQEKDYVGASLRRAKLGARIRVGVMSVIALLAVLAGVLGLTARSAQKEAEQRRADAEGLMSFMLGDFVDKLRPLGRLDLLDSVSAKALPHLSRESENDGTPESLTQRAKALQLIAEVDVARGRQASAERALQAASRILQRQLAGAPQDRRLLKELGVNAFWHGQIQYDRSNWNEAAAHMARYLAYSERQVSLAPNDIDALLELSYAHNSAGSVALRREDMSAAAAAFARSLELKQRVQRAAPDRPDIDIDLSNAYSWLASTRAKQGALQEAMVLYRREEALLAGALRARPSNALWTQRLSSSLWRQADLLQALGDNPGARRLYAQAIALLGPIAKGDPTNQMWQRSIQTMRLRALALDNGAAADIATVDALAETLRTASEAAPGLRDLKHMLAKTYELNARILWREGAPDRAMAALQRATGVYVDARAKGSDGSLDAGYVQALLLEAELRKRRGEADWQAGCRTVRSLLAPAQQGSDYRLLAPLAMSMLCLDDSTAAQPIVERLARMGYQESYYKSTISQYQSKQGKI